MSDSFFGGGYLSFVIRIAAIIILWKVLQNFDAIFGVGKDNETTTAITMESAQ